MGKKRSKTKSTKRKARPRAEAARDRSPDRGAKEPQRVQPPQDPSDGGGLERQDTLVAVGLGLITFALYGVTLCRTVYVGDSGELVSAAWSFGVVHPPGYPLFTLLYGTLMHLLPFGDIALRANLVTAALATGAVVLVFYAARLWSIPRFAALAAAAGLAVTGNFWAQAVSVEVYALDAFLWSGSLVAALHVIRRPGTWRSWLLFGVVLGLCLGHRPVNLFYALILGGFVAWTLRATEHRTRRWLTVLAGMAATGLIYLYLPLSAAADPPINMGDPETLGRFWDVVRAKPYTRHFKATTSSLAMDRMGAALIDLPKQLGLCLAAAIWGLIIALQDPKRRLFGGALLAVIVVNQIFTSLYSILDYSGYYQPGLVTFALLAGVGFGDVLRRLGRAPWAPVALVLAAVLPALWAFRANDLSDVREVDRYTRDLLDSAERDAIILVFGDTMRAGLGHQQVSNRYRRDVAVIGPSLIGLPWHRDNVRRRTPGFKLPRIRADENGWLWLRRVLRHQLVDRGKAVYTTSPESTRLNQVLDPELARRAGMVPAGLLYRIVLVPSDKQEATRLRRRLIDEAGQRFWRKRRVPQPRTGRVDPQLDMIPINYARARFLLAVEYVFMGQKPLVEAHLRDVAESDADQREKRVVAAFKLIGRSPKPRRFGKRARDGLRLLRSGAGQRSVLQALAGRTGAQRRRPPPRPDQ